MRAAKLPNEDARMYECCEAMTTFMKEVGVAIDDGKDSLSMAARVNREDVKAPGTLVVTMYAPTEDVELKVTPDLKPHVICRHRQGCESFRWFDVGTSVYGQVCDVSSDVEDATLFKNVFNGIQTSIKQGHIIASHDRSDGGLIVTLLEMAFAGNCCFDELGFSFQVAAGQHAADLETIFSSLDVPVMKLGKVTTDGVIKVNIDGENVLKDEMVDLRAVWEATSFEFEKRQCNPDCVAQEQRSLRMRTGDTRATIKQRCRHRVVVLREEGSNGEREMFAAFHHAGFEVWDVTMSDLVHKRMVLDRRFRCVAFVGGFTFADVLGSAKEWARVFKFHPDVLAQFAAFKARDDTFSFGACNGCQFMTMLGWVTHLDTQGLESEIRTLAAPRFVHNESGLQSRIQASNAVMLRGMADTCIGVWVSHGEDHAHFSHAKMQETYLATDAAAIRYEDESNHPTEAYPFNPNRSSHGIAVLVSTDGSHLCFMPHPERCFLKYQWPYVPPTLQAYPVSPWIIPTVPTT
ncbi:hypothetical protein PsorP6_004295 [Peronosclerospora sorghi]|uniref:Uncharacterized protein n=1 Tax=Peronosclerospora sorghi TaxID=230839 RepID=A0ACC0VNY7_9STRA|nr:hypothetical protein PsorP6_004295 [Peronosclerospora sorghi]